MKLYFSVMSCLLAGTIGCFNSRDLATAEKKPKIILLILRHWLFRATVIVYYTGYINPIVYNPPCLP